MSWDITRLPAHPYTAYRRVPLLHSDPELETTLLIRSWETRYWPGYKNRTNNTLQQSDRLSSLFPTDTDWPFLNVTCLWFAWITGSRHPLSYLRLDFTTLIIARGWPEDTSRSGPAGTWYLPTPRTGLGCSPIKGPSHDRTITPFSNTQQRSQQWSSL